LHFLIKLRQQRLSDSHSGSSVLSIQQKRESL
jgi:hypothetical protein